MPARNATHEVPTVVEKHSKLESVSVILIKNVLIRKPEDLPLYQDEQFSRRYIATDQPVLPPHSSSTTHLCIAIKRDSP